MRQRLLSLQFVVGRGGLSPKGLFDGFAQGSYAQEMAVREFIFFNVFQVAFGQDEGVEAHLGRFFDAAQGLRDAAYVAGKADFAHDDGPAVHGDIPQAGVDGQGYGQVRCGLSQAQAADDVDIDVLAPQRYAQAFFQDGQKDDQAVIVHARCCPPRDGEDGMGRQGLDFTEHGPHPVEDSGHG